MDLDETLYPKSNGLWSAIGERINIFIVSELGVSDREAQQIRAEYLAEYGTTLNGLRANHDIDPNEYLDFVHDVPVEEFIHEDQQLKAMLSRLNQRKIIYTNAHRAHASRVMQALGITDQVHQVIDLYALEFRNKPQPESYKLALNLAGNPIPGECIFADDRAVNLIPASHLGMTTILVGDGESQPAISFHIGQITQLPEVIPQLYEGPAHMEKD